MGAVDTSAGSGSHRDARDQWWLWGEDARVVVISAAPGSGRTHLLSGPAPQHVRRVAAPHRLWDPVDLWHDVCDPPINPAGLQGLINIDRRADAAEVLLGELMPRVGSDQVVVLDDLDRADPVTRAVWMQWAAQSAGPRLVATVGDDSQARELLDELGLLGAAVVDWPGLGYAERLAMVGAVAGVAIDDLSDELRALAEAGPSNLHLLELAVQSVCAGGSGDPARVVGEVSAVLSPGARAVLVARRHAEMIGVYAPRLSGSGPPLDAWAIEVIALSATGLGSAAARQAIAELRQLGLCEANGAIRGQVWRDVAVDLADLGTSEPIRERVIELALAAGVSAVRVADLVATAPVLGPQCCDLLCEAIESVLPTRADIGLEWVRVFGAAPNLDAERSRRIVRLTVRAKAARDEVDLRSRVATTTLAFMHSPGTDEVGLTRMAAFSQVMLGNLRAAGDMYARLAQGADQSGVDPEITLEHASVAILSAEWDLSRRLAESVIDPQNAPRIQVGGMSLSLVVDTLTGSWVAAESWARALETALATLDSQDVGRILGYQPWLNLAQYQMYVGDLSAARHTIEAGIAMVEAHGAPWMLPAHWGLAAQIAVRSGRIAEARHLAEQALADGPEADGLGAAGWSFGVLMWISFLIGVDEPEIFERWSTWDAPVTLMGVEQPWLRAAEREMLLGRVDLGRALLFERWREARSAQLATSLLDMGPWVAQSALLVGDDRLVAEVAEEMGALDVSSGGGLPAVRWAVAFAEGCRELSASAIARVVNAAMDVDASRLPLLAASIGAHSAFLCAVCGESARAEAMRERSIEVWNSMGAQGRAREFARLQW